MKKRIPKNAYQHNMDRRKWLKAGRVDALIRQGKRCMFCRDRLTRDDVTAEHLTPRSKGGGDDFDNIGASCLRCNHLRGNLSVGAFRRLLKSRDPASFDIQFVRTIRRINIRGERAVTRIHRLVGIAA